MIEVAAVTFVGGEVVREWSALLFPEDVDWTHKDVLKALEVNRIAVDDLRGKPPFEQILPDLLVELAHSVLVAHNAEFDLRMIDSELKRLGHPALAPQLTICTKNLASKLNNGQSGNRLDQVAPRFGVTPEDAHRAVVDARTCGLVLAEMNRRALLPSHNEAMATFCQQAAAQWRGRYNR